MSEIVNITGSKVSIGMDNGEIVTVPIASLNFANPAVGDEVKVYRNDKETIVKRIEAKPSSAPHSGQGSYHAKEIKINKHIFVWVGAFFLSGLGVDRFMRGQIGIGICKLLFGWITGGIWHLIDWIIALVKAYGSAFGNDEDIVFINGKYAR
ncbi:TM2 domain-containing protein [Candidatus Saccharibacteria bacterium]|nr:TM2 domain-containing protein [Candidatus Saccharibacteria bacterium]